jgi:hypothetical protein
LSPEERARLAAEDANWRSNWMPEDRILCAIQVILDESRWDEQISDDRLARELVRAVDIARDPSRMLRGKK